MLQSVVHLCCFTLSFCHSCSLPNHCVFGLRCITVRKEHAVILRKISLPRRSALGQMCSAAAWGIEMGRAFFLASRPLEAAKGAARTWQPLGGRLTRCRQSQQWQRWAFQIGCCHHFVATHRGDRLQGRRS